MTSQVWGGGDQAFQEHNVTSSETENSPDLTHYFSERVQFNKGKNNVWDSIRPNFKGPKVTVSITEKNHRTRPTIFRKGPFSKHIGSP